MKVGKIQWKRTGAMLAAVLIGISAAAMPAAAETMTAEDVRGMQQNALYWENERTEEEGVLSGSVLDAAGTPDSDWVAFSISRMGVEDNQAAYLYRLRETVEEMYADQEKTKKEHLPSDLCRIALTVNACGGDASSFGIDPEGNSIDLINDAVWNCIYGDPGMQGINGYMWALAAADSQDYQEVPGAAWKRKKLLEAILFQQHPDGGFSLNPAEEADTDLTAMMLTILAPYEESADIYEGTNAVTNETQSLTAADVCARAADYLEKHIEADGTVKSMDQSNSESTGWTLLGLSAHGVDCAADPAVLQTDGTGLLDGLKRFQLENGGFVHSLDKEQADTTGNAMATYQALYHMEGYCRLAEGRERLFHITDAKTVSDDEISKAGETLGERKMAETAVVGVDNDSESSGENAAEAGSGNKIRIIAIAAAVVLLVLALAAWLLLREKKGSGKAAAGSQPAGIGSQKTSDTDAGSGSYKYEDDEDEDEEW
ncbi:MAG: terpene cyclase/mutase family protein [Eubacteriales bacterium]|nr:terpene cyclase/mutase family protein [Eubacteriales bacterium]